MPKIKIFIDLEDISKKKTIAFLSTNILLEVITIISKRIILIGYFPLINILRSKVLRELEWIKS